MYVPGNPAYEHHLKTYGPQSKFGYKDFIPMFKAEKFDPAAWVKLFTDAGAKYVIPVAEHCDGFAMYDRSEEHTSELQSLMRISYAVFCLKKKTKIHTRN